MRFLAAALLAGLAAVALASPEPGTDLILRDECGEIKACVPMILNYGQLGEKVRVGSRPLPDGWYTEFMLRVRGRLAGAAASDHRVVVRGYTGAIDCCDFGQANAAVLGYTNDGKPVVLTSRGPLALSDDSLRVGCPRCIKVVNALTGKEVAAYPSPAWALHLTGHDESDFFLADSADLFVHQGNSCVQIYRNAMFRVVSDARCTGKPPQTLRLVIESGACT